MGPTTGFYQPLDSWNQILWMWWAILTMLGVIISSERMYQMPLWLAIYLIILVVTGIFAFARHRLYLTGSQLFMGYALRRTYAEYNLDSGLYWQLHGRRLSIQSGSRLQTYWISKRMACKLKEIKQDDRK